MTVAEIASSDPITRIFRYWAEIMNYKRARLDEKRRRAVNGRIKEGYSEEDLRLAIEGCYLSPFHQGDNESNARYDDLTLICRDATHVDRFICRAEECFDRHARITASRVQPVQAPQVYDFDKARAMLAEVRKAMTKNRAA